MKAKLTANELRLGIWVEKSSGYWKLQEMDFLSIEQILESSKPIPLDKEWLLKFGFKFTKIHKGFNQYRNKGVLELSITPNGFEIFFNYKWIIIEYVHTFQNLHFALTGVKLKITEPIKDKIQIITG